METLWKAVIIAWIAWGDAPPTFLQMEREGAYLTEAACEAKLKADALRIEGMLETYVAQEDGELLSHVTACVEDDGGQAT